jgi:RNB domain
MSLRRSSGKLATSATFNDICLRCQVRLSQSERGPLQRLQRGVVKRSFRSCAISLAINGSRFSTSTRSRSLEISQPEVPGPFADGAVPIIRKTNRNPRQPAKSRGAFIRSELQAWSVENERQKRENAPENIPARGKIFELPQSYFMPEPEPEVDIAEDMSDLPDTTEGELDFEEAPRHLQPGDLALVQYRGKGRSELGVFIGPLGFQALFLMPTGRWLVSFSRVVAPSMTHHGFASEDEIAEIRDRMPLRPIERETLPGWKESVKMIGDIVVDQSNPIIQRIAALKNEVDTFKRNNLPLLDSIYECNAHKTEYVVLPFDSLMEKVIGPAPTRAAQWAIFWTIKRDPIHMTLADFGREHTLVLIITPQQLSEQFASVVNWTRRYQDAAAQATMGSDVAALLQENPVTSFVEKSRRIILASRKIRSPTTAGVLGPAKDQRHLPDGKIETKSTKEVWSATDKMIVNFMWHTYCRSPIAIGVTRHNATASLILRAVGAYPKMDLNRDIGQLFLQEIGAMPPFGQTHFNDIRAPFPGQKGSEELTRMRAAADELSDQLGFDPETGQNPLPDLLGDIRKDWTNAEVLCIDSKGTRILDDGISLESCTERPNCYWIHIHMAHPAAFFDRNHPFARVAREQLSSLYTSHSYVPMLPSKVAEIMSLGNAPQAMTVSTLLDEDGRVVDIKIQASTIPSITRLSPRACADLMGESTPEIAYLIVGNDPLMPPTGEEKATAQELEQAREYLPTLKKIDELLLARNRARRTENPNVYDPWLRIHPRQIRCSTLEPLSATRTDESYHYLGDPAIKIEVHRYTKFYRASSERLGMVGEAMSLACESAAKWSHDRNVPTLYAVSTFHPEWPTSRLNKQEPGQKRMKPLSDLSTTPKLFAPPHCLYYTKITSPLRRFTDMVGQWNISAYLLAEAKGIIPPGSSLEEETAAPWSTAELHEFIMKESWKMDEITIVNALADYMMGPLALFRAFHFNEAELPKVWDVNVLEKTGRKMKDKAKLLNGEDMSGITGLLEPFAFRVLVLKSKEGWENSVRAGQFLPCRIESVKPLQKIIHVVPVGPPSDDYTQRGEIKIWSLAGTDEQNKEKPDTDSTGTGGEMPSMPEVGTSGQASKETS